MKPSTCPRCAAADRLYLSSDLDPGHSVVGATREDLEGMLADQMRAGMGTARIRCCRDEHGSDGVLSFLVRVLTGDHTCDMSVQLKR